MNIEALKEAHDLSLDGRDFAARQIILDVIANLEKEALAQPEQEQEPVDFASLLREAEEIVQSKPTWKRFIDGTPLANDIAVWMAVFAQDVARRTSPSQSQPDERNFCQRCGKRTADLTTIHTCTPPQGNT